MLFTLVFVCKFLQIIGIPARLLMGFGVTTSEMFDRAKNELLWRCQCASWSYSVVDLESGKNMCQLRKLKILKDFVAVGVAH